MEPSEGRFCPVCKFKNETGAESCAFCGVNLSSLGADSFPTTEMMHAGTTDLSHLPEFKTDALIPRGAVAFFLIDGVKPIKVCTGNEIILGRLLECGSASCVDVTPHGGFDQGVSRRHAAIHRRGAVYTLTDLDSTNGTSLNQVRLSPSQPYDLNSGDIIWLARLPLRVLFLDSPANPPALQEPQA